MSNPDRSPFDHTNDPDLTSTLGADVTMGADLTRQAEDSKKKSAAKNKVIMLVIGLLVLGGVGKVVLDQLAAPEMPKAAMKPPQQQPAPLDVAQAPPASNAATLPVMAPPSETKPSEGVSVSVSAQQGAPVLAPPAANVPIAPQVSGPGNITVFNPGQAPTVAPIIPGAPVLPGQPPAAPEAQNAAPNQAVVHAAPTVDMSQYVKQEDLSKIASRVESMEREIQGLSQFDSRIKTLEGFHAKDFKALEKKAQVATPASGDNGSEKPAVKKATKPSSSTNGSNQQKSNSKGASGSGNGRGFWLEDGDNGSMRKGSGSDVSKRGLGNGSSVNGNQSGFFKEDRSESLDMSGNGGAGASSAQQKEGNFINSGNRRAPVAPYQLIAIMQDRAWVKLPDGSMSTVQAGEFLPNGDKVLKIDVARDEVKTSGGLLR